MEFPFFEPVRNLVFLLALFDGTGTIVWQNLELFTSGGIGVPCQLTWNWS
jgi:hypothetical protein